MTKAAPADIAGAAFSGGDGGNRTRVRNIWPETSTSV